jgi:hypothetical protein
MGDEEFWLRIFFPSQRSAHRPGDGVFGPWVFV